MAQERIAWCDVHRERGEYVRGRTLVVQVMSDEPRAVGICCECAERILGPAQDLLDKHGRTPGERSVRDGEEIS